MKTIDVKQLAAQHFVIDTQYNFYANMRMIESFAQAIRNAALDEAAGLCQDEMDEQFCDSNPWYAARACRDAIRALKEAK